MTFVGYTVSVPASWPVYDLTKNPRQCVRYDVHAVYLGTPGPNPDCPPNLVGRVDTVTIQAPAASAGTQTAGSSKGPRQGGQRALRTGRIVQDPDRHELALAMPDKAPSIGATYGTRPDAAEQMLAAVRQASTPAAGRDHAGREAGRARTGRRLDPQYRAPCRRAGGRARRGEESSLAQGRSDHRAGRVLAHAAQHAPVRLQAHPQVQPEAQPCGQGGRGLPDHRRGLGGRRGRAKVTGGSPIRTGRIQFAMPGPGS